MGQACLVKISEPSESWQVPMLFWSAGAISSVCAREPPAFLVQLYLSDGDKHWIKCSVLTVPYGGMSNGR